MYNPQQWRRDLVSRAACGDWAARRLLCRKGALSVGLRCILSGISSGILSDILFGVLSGISSGILSGRWGPAVPTELGRSQVEVQRCPLSSEGPRLRSSGAHWARKVPGWGPGAHWARKPAVEVQRYTAWQLRSSHYRINNIVIIFKIYPNIIDYICFFR